MTAAAAAAAVLALAWLQLSPADLATRQGARDVFPRAFHGTWASSQSECRGSDWVDIDAIGYRAPDIFAVVVRIVRVERHRTPAGELAFTVLGRMQANAEGHDVLGRIRISRSGPHLYMSNPDVVSEREHWQLRNLRCPYDLRGSTPDILPGRRH